MSGCWGECACMMVCGLVFVYDGVWIGVRVCMCVDRCGTHKGSV